MDCWYCIHCCKTSRSVWVNRYHIFFKKYLVNHSVWLKHKIGYLKLYQKKSTGTGKNILIQMSRFVPYILDIVPKIQFGSIKSIESKVIEIVSNESTGTVKRYFDLEESIRTVHLIYCPKIQFGLIKSIESSNTVDLFREKHFFNKTGLSLWTIFLSQLHLWNPISW